MARLRPGAWALVFVTAALVLTLSPRAFGYCRTITEPLPADFPQTEQCFEPAGSIPLWWSGACVGFSVQQDASKQVSWADADAIRVLISGLKGSKAPLRLLPALVLHDAAGAFTPVSAAIHRGEAVL